MVRFSSRWSLGRNRLRPRLGARRLRAVDPSRYTPLWAPLTRAPLVLVLLCAVFSGAVDRFVPPSSPLLAAPPPSAKFDDAAALDLRLGKGLYDQGLFERALPPLEKVRSGSPGKSQREEALFLLGEAYRSLDQLDKAEARFGELLRFAPQSEWAALAQLGRGESLVRLDRAQEAVQILEAATRGAEPDRPVAHYWLAEARVRLGQLDAAIAGWSTIVESAPNHELAPYAAYNAALRCRDAKEPARGLALLDRVLRSKLEDSMADRLHLIAGELALLGGDPARSISEYQSVKGKDSQPAALAGAAWAAKEAGDSRALASIRRRLSEQFESSPERLEVDLLFGSARAEAGDIEGTDEALRRHKSGARQDEAIFWCAWARRVAGQPLDAGEMFASIDGSGEWAARGTLRAEEEFRKAKEWQKSLLAARRFISEWREDPRASAVVAGAVESSYRLGDDARVLDLEKSFSAQWPDDPFAGDVRHYAAVAALRTEKPAQAVELFAALWRESSRRPAIASRYAWALLAADPESAPARISALLPSLEGGAASEVGVLLGRAHATGGDLDAALKAYRRAAESDPKGEFGTRARLEEAILLGGSDVSDVAAQRAAEQAYRAVLEGNATEVVRARARIDLALLLAGRGDDRAAQPEFVRYLDDHVDGADRADAWLGLAFSRWRLDDQDGALAAVNGLRKEGTDATRRAEALYIEGRVGLESGDREGAARALTAYLENHGDGPRVADVLRELARVAEDRGDSERAIELLERRLADHPRATASDEALYRVAWLRLSAGDEGKAAKGFSSLVSQHPKSEFAGDAHFRLGEIAYAADDHKAARAAFTAAISCGTGKAAGSEGTSSPEGSLIAERARYRLGWSYRKGEEWARAAEVFETLVRENPTGDLAGEALYLAADAADRGERPLDASRLLERFLDEYPKHERSSAAKIRLAETLADKEEWARIRTLLDPLRTTQLEEPWNTRHRIALGRALVRLGSGKRAVPILTEALAEGGARAAEAQFEIGLAHRQAGDRDRAIEAFIHGPVLYPFKPWALRSHLEAGRDLLATGKRREASRLLKLAIEQDPEGPIGREAKRMLEGADDKESFR